MDAYRVCQCRVANPDWAANRFALQAFSVAFALLGVLWGLSSWAYQHQAQKDSEVSEEALLHTYRFQDALKQIRNPVSFGTETNNLERGNHESKNQFQLRKQYALYGIRAEKHTQTFSDLKLSAFQVRARFDDEYSQRLIDLLNYHYEVLGAAIALFRLQQRTTFRTEGQYDEH